MKIPMRFYFIYNLGASSAPLPFPLQFLSFWPKFRIITESRIYFNIVDLCGILPYKRMYPYKCGIKINIDISTTQRDQ